MLLKFNLDNKELILNEVYFINDKFIIGLHPVLNKKCLFLSSDNISCIPMVEKALAGLKLEVSKNNKGKFNNISFKILEEI